MKTQILITAALFISGAAFAQANNEHGIVVSNSAKSETTVQTKGAAISEVASERSNALVRSDEAKLNGKAANHLAVKGSHQEGTEISTKAGNQTALKASVRSDAGIHKQGLPDLKSGVGTSEKTVIGITKKVSNTAGTKLKATKKTAVRNSKNIKLKSPVKAKAKVKNSINVQLSHPHISGSLPSAAGLGI